MMLLFIFVKGNTHILTINKALGVLNGATDLYIFIIPLVAIFRLAYVFEEKARYRGRLHDRGLCKWNSAHKCTRNPNPGPKVQLP